MARPLDSHSQRSLVLCAVAGDTAGKNLASLGNVSLQLIGILVIDYIILAAEYAHFLSSADTTLFLMGASDLSALLKAMSMPPISHNQT